MSYLARAIGVLALAAGVAVPAAAQEPPAPPASHAVTVAVRGGGLSALTDLDDAGIADFKTGFNLGGGVSVDLTRYVALRGDFTWGRDELRLNGQDTGIDFDKFFYGAAVQLQYPTASGVRPYVFAGGGGVTLDPRNGAGSSKTKGAGTFGLGVGYLLPRTNWELFAQSTGWVYKVSDMDGPLAG